DRAHQRRRHQRGEEEQDVQPVAVLELPRPHPCGCHPRLRTGWLKRGMVEVWQTRVVDRQLLTADVVQVFAWLESNRPAGWDADFLARPRIAPNAALARLDLEDAEAPQFDPL